MEFSSWNGTRGTEQGLLEAAAHRPLATCSRNSPSTGCFPQNAEKRREGITGQLPEGARS